MQGALDQKNRVENRKAPLFIEGKQNLNEVLVWDVSETGEVTAHVVSKSFIYRFVLAKKH